MIRIARANAPRATFKVGTLALAKIPRCAAILAVGEVVGYVTDPPTQLTAFFRRAAASLDVAGMLIFDFIESSDGRTFDAKSRAGADWAIVTRATARGRFLMRDMMIFRKVGPEYRRAREVHRVRLYPREEVAGALRRAGFDRVVFRRSIGGVRLIRSDLLAIAQRSPERRRSGFARGVDG
jgi:hypothetical protein